MVADPDTQLLNTTLYKFIDNNNRIVTSHSKPLDGKNYEEI